MDNPSMVVLITASAVNTRGAEGKGNLTLYVAENGRDEWSGMLAAPDAGQQGWPVCLHHSGA